MTDFDQIEGRLARLRLQDVETNDNGSDTAVSVEGAESGRQADTSLELLNNREENLAVDLRTATDIVERQACMTEEGLALSERKERQQTHAKIYAGPDHRGVIIQDSSNVNLSIGGHSHGVMEQCILDLKVTKTKEVFAETANYARVNRILKAEGHVTISGASGEGKTSQALMLGVKYKKSGYDLVFVNDIDKFRLDDHIEPGRKTFFIFDDIFGSVGLSTDVPQLRKILQELQLFLEAKTSDQQIHDQQKVPTIRVVFTTKTYNLECGMSKLEGQEFFFFKGPTVVDLTKVKSCQYTFEEKEKIFQKHKKKHDDIPIEFAEVYDAEQFIFGFPLTCQLFFEFHAFQANPKEFFKTPLFYLRREIEKILEKRDEKSAALILLLLCDDKMDLMQVEKEFKGTSFSRLFQSVLSIVPNVTGISIARAARTFRGTFFTAGDVIGFSHPSIYDACGCVLYRNSPTFVLENCSVKFLYERLKDKSLEEASVSDHLHVIYVSDSYNDIIAERLAQEIERGNYSMSITHPILKKEEIVNKLFSILKFRKRTPLQRVFATSTSTERILHSSEQGKHLLYWTIHSHSLYLVQKVLDIGYNFSDTEMIDAFEACASCGNLPVMKFLISKYATIKQCTIYKAMVTATGNSYSEMVKYLLECCKDIPSEASRTEDNILSIALTQGNLCIVSNIISTLCKTKKISHLCQDTFIAADNLLHMACRLGDINLTTFIIPVTNVNKKLDGLTAVIRAAHHGQRKVFDLLVSKGANLTLTDNNSNSVLHYAGQGGNTYIVEQVLPLFDINIRGMNGGTPVMKAALSGQREVFDLLVSKGANLTLTDNNSNNVLHYASQGGNTYIVEQVLPLFDINITGINGSTPVMIAALSGQREVFDLLVSKRADLTLTDNNSNNVLHYASQGGNTYIVEQVLPLFDINLRGINGRTPVMRAALSGQREVFDLLVSKGANLTLTDNNSNNVLHYASEGGNTYIVEQVLPLFDINIRGIYVSTPVMRAALSGQREVFNLLVSKGANLTLTDNNNNNVLHYASEGGNTYIVEQVLPLFDINIRGMNGRTPVMIAALSGQREVFDLLVSKGADLTVTDNNSNNVLHYASEGGNTYIVEQVLPLFDINIRGMNGRTPVMIAALSGQREVFDLLVSKGANLTVTNNNSNNVLHYASQGGNTYIVEQVLPLFDINIRGMNGHTPVMKAALGGQREVFDLLVSKGANLTVTDNNSNNVLHYARQGGNTYIVEQVLPLF